MNATNAALLWNPGTSQVVVVPWPIEHGLDRVFKMSALGPSAEMRSLGFEARKARVFIEAMHLIVRDRCNPMSVHRALLNLEEYRDGLSDDMPVVE